MNQPVKHHFLPRVYLEQFSNSSGKIWCLDNETRKIFSSSARGIAYKSDYNTATLPDGTRDRSTVESFYSSFESKIPNIYNGLQNQDITFDDQRNLIILAALQIIRSPATRHLIREIADRFMPVNSEWNSALGMNDLEIEILEASRRGERWAEDELELRLSGHTFNYIIKILEGMSFQVLKFSGELNLITSDNPAILTGVYRDARKVWKLLPNFQKNRIILVYPLTPSVLLFGDNWAQKPNSIFSFGYSNFMNGRTIQAQCNTIVKLTHKRNIYSNNQLSLETIRSHSTDYSEKSGSQTTQNQVALSVGKFLGAFYSQSSK